MKKLASQPVDDPLRQQIFALENALLIGPERYDADFLARTLHADFTELDARGRTTEREDAIDWLLAVDSKIQWQIDNFSIQPITQDVVVSHFRVLKTTNAGQRYTLHSGVWRKTKDVWQLVFHQGTYAPD